MPQVPLYNGPQVKERPLQPVMQRAPDVSSGLQTIGRALEGIGQAADREVQRQAEAEANRIDTEITAGWLEWDAQARPKYRGQNVGEYEAEARKWWSDARDKYGAGASPLVRERIGQGLARKQTQALGSVLGYVGAERERFADDSAEAAAQTTIEFGVDTGDTAGAAARVRQIAAEKGARKGWDTAMVQAEQQRLLGTLHLSAITRMADSDPAKATAYYEANKGEIPATAQAKVEQLLKASGDNLFATQFAAERASLPLSEQLAQAGKITDPERREKALQQVRNNHALVQQAQREREQAASDEAWQIVGGGKRPPETVLMRMNGRERVQLQDYLRERAKQAASGESVKTDWPTYIDLRERLAAGEKVDLRPYAYKVAGPQLEQLLDIQTRASDPKKAPEVASAEQQIGTYIDTLKLSGASDQGKRGQFKAAAQDLFNEHLKRTGKEPTFDERQKILDQLTIEVVTKPGWLWDTKGPAYTLPREALRQQATDPFETGKVYRDGNGNRAKYLGAGKWEPVK